MLFKRHFFPRISKNKLSIYGKHHRKYKLRKNCFESLLQLICSSVDVVAIQMFGGTAATNKKAQSR
jgi:hypothetical protein